MVAMICYELQPPFMWHLRQMSLLIIYIYWGWGLDGPREKPAANSTNM